MHWIQVKFDIEKEEHSLFETMLCDQGALAVTLEDAHDQPLFEPAPGDIPLWQHIRIVGLFPAETPQDSLIKGLEQAYRAASKIEAPTLTPPRIEILEDKDWVREWMNQYQPIQFGKKLWIVPSWQQPVDQSAVNLVLDPGLAFGTGTHATTHLCLEWLEQQPLSGLNVVDYGCGSGILAIAALLLGADHALAVDNDPNALLATQDNAEKNSVADRLTTALPRTHGEAAQADLTIANILAGPLIALASELAQLTQTDGTLVLSGILPDQAEEVSAAYEPWFNMETPSTLDGWVRLNGVRKPHDQKPLL